MSKEHAWRCPKCGQTYELGEAAWTAFDPNSPPWCPDDKCGAELESNL